MVMVQVKLSYNPKSLASSYSFKETTSSTCSHIFLQASEGSYICLYFFPGIATQVNFFFL
jgi:hypothetical protein